MPNLPGFTPLTKAIGQTFTFTATPPSGGSIASAASWVETDASGNPLGSPSGVIGSFSSTTPFTTATATALASGETYVVVNCLDALSNPVASAPFPIAVAASVATIVGS